MANISTEDINGSLQSFVKHVYNIRLESKMLKSVLLFGIGVFPFSILGANDQLSQKYANFTYPHNTVQQNYDVCFFSGEEPEERSLSSYPEVPFEFLTDPSREESQKKAFELIEQIKNIFKNTKWSQIARIEKLVASLGKLENIYTFVTKISDLKECVLLLLKIEEIKSKLPFNLKQDVARRIRVFSVWINGINPSTEDLTENSDLNYIHGIKNFLDSYTIALIRYCSYNQALALVNQALAAFKPALVNELMEMYKKYPCDLWDLWHKGNLHWQEHKKNLLLSLL